MEVLVLSATTVRGEPQPLNTISRDSTSPKWSRMGDILPLKGYHRLNASAPIARWDESGGELYASDCVYSGTATVIVMDAKREGFSLSQLRFPWTRELRITIPTIASRADFVNLVAMKNVIPKGSRIALDFSSCGRLTPNALIFLGGLVALARAEGGSARILDTTLRPKMREHLAENGILAYLGSPGGGVRTGALPFEHYARLDKSQFMYYLENKWLGSGAVELSENLRAAIMGNAWEVYANAFEHSESPIGIVNSGSFDRENHTLLLSVMDLGIGIPESVRRFRPDKPIHPGRALKWAFADGTSTKAEAVGYSRGLGLHTLKEFIKVNKGFLEVFSNDGYAKITHSKESYRRHAFSFPGTLVQISLSADERFYCFEDEVPKFRRILGQ